MQWSRLKQRVEAQFAPALNGRVQVWATLYRKPATTDGRGWITVDGEQIFSMADRWSDAAHAAEWAAIQAAQQAEPGSPESVWVNQPAASFTHRDFRGALECFVDSTVEDLLACEWPLYRALVMLDRRLGKRRFLRLQRVEEEHPLVQALYRLRAEAEGWRSALDPAKPAQA